MFFFGGDGPFDFTYQYSDADVFGIDGAFYVDMAMKLDCGHHRVGFATAGFEGGFDCSYQRLDFGAIDVPEVVELGMSLAGNDIKVVQSRRSKAKMRSRAATVGRNEALSTITDMNLQ